MFFNLKKVLSLALIGGIAFSQKACDVRRVPFAPLIKITKDVSMDSYGPQQTRYIFNHCHQDNALFNENANKRNSLLAPRIVASLHTIYQALIHRLHSCKSIVLDIGISVGKGVIASIKEISRLNHYKSMFVDTLQLICFVIHTVAKDFHALKNIMASLLSGNSIALSQSTHAYATLLKNRAQDITLFTQEMYKEVKAMSWQELTEQGVYFCFTIVFDLVTFHFFSSVSKSIYQTIFNRFGKQLSKVTPCCKLLHHGSPLKNKKKTSTKLIKKIKGKKTKSIKIFRKNRKQHTLDNKIKHCSCKNKSINDVPLNVGSHSMMCLEVENYVMEATQYMFDYYCKKSQC